MLFNSIEYVLFLPIVFAAYWIASKRLSLQNLIILIASYTFYGWWDVRFLSLVAASTVIDFLVARRMVNATSDTIRKRWLAVSLVANLGMLGVFKYYDFFVGSLTDGLQALGLPIELQTLNIILPVGISFYTFQTLSYSIDVYRGRIQPSNDLIAFAAFVAFFPQLVAGPIERAENLLPQFAKPRAFSYTKGVAGLRIILWGLFKKIVIADTCGRHADLIFGNYSEFSAPTLILGAVYFAFQIYGDFSGYSDIAIGSAKLFGFDLMRNFDFPYFSRDIAEFWRRWHISLSTWFRDYLYLPLGGSRYGKLLTARNVMVIFVVSGLWHGANWTYVVWGAVNGLYFLPLILSKRNRTHLDTVAKGSLFPTGRQFIQMTVTFSLTCFTWILFRSESLEYAASYFHRILSPSAWGSLTSVSGIPLVAAFVGLEWSIRERDFGGTIASWSTPARWAIYWCLSIAIMGYWGRTQDNFIYFQF